MDGTEKNAIKNLGKLFVAICATVYFLYYAKTATDWHFIDNFNLIIHEAGHSILFFLGEFIQVAAGSLFQILLPLIFVLYFYLHKNYFSSSLLLFWVGQNVINVSVYLSDAIITQLPLLGGDSSIHDWNYLLNSLGILKHTSTIGSLTFDAGVLIIILAAYFSTVTSQKK
ncbi:MAG: hypothetical protein AAB446_03100 [Patescibacteria group bacterium]